METKHDFLTLAAERYSVRQFQPRPVEAEKVEMILKAGHLAPTAKNSQPQRVLVIESEEAREKRKGVTRCHFDAPLALLVCTNTDECWRRSFDGKSSEDVDAAIVATHMMLEAADLGVGSCWVMFFDPAAARTAYAIPPEVTPVALLVMGYPAEGVLPAPRHGEFRPEAELVVRNSF